MIWISEPVEVRIPEELDPPIGGAVTLVIVRLFKIESVNRIMKKPVEDRR